MASNAETHDLSYNSLEALPDIDSEEAVSVKELTIDHNDLTIISRTISLFKNLQSLDISNNRISYISPEIGSLTGLKHLIARNNLLEDDSLPKELLQLQKLEVLNLSGNLLTVFPPFITEFVHLRRLHLGANRIEAVPGDIECLSR